MGAPKSLLTAASLRPRPGLVPISVAIVAFVAYAATLLGVASPRAALFSTLTHLTFAVPGVFIVRAVTGVRAGWLAPLTFGPLLGLAVSTFALLGLWALGARGAWALAVAPLQASLLAWPARRLEGRVRLANTAGADWTWLAVVILIAPVVIARAFSLVGAEVAEGQAYRAYFTADYVWRRAVVAELAKGDFLPVNPFYTGDTLHYYWLPHLLNALEYMVAGQSFTLDQLLLTYSVFVDALFVAFLYGVGRVFVAPPWAVAAGVACAVLFSSFEGAYSLWDHWRVGAPYHLVRYLNIDAITRWMLQAMPVDGLHRVLLYQPHHALGYAIGYAGVLVIARRSRRHDPVIFAVAGGLLGLSVLISSFGGLMFTAVAAVYEAASVLRARDWRRAVLHGSAAAAPLGVAAAIVMGLEYVDRGGQVLLFGLNPVAVHNALDATLLSFGPVLLLGGAGGWIAWRARRADLLVAGAIVLTSVVFYFFVDIRDHGDVYVGWRVGHLVFIASAVLIAVLFERAGELPPRRRATAGAAIAVVLIAAAPTLGIDLYNTQDIENTRMGPGFRWTLVLSRDELQAFEWIKANTVPSAIFQVDPVARDSNTWAYLPAFAERRMAVGLPISMVPIGKYERGSWRVREMLSQADPVDTHHLATELSIRYILSGPPERSANPKLQVRLDSRSDLFPLLFRNGSISIYGVVPKPLVP